MIATAQRTGRRRWRISVAVVHHVTAGARDVISGGDRAAAEVNGRQVVVDGAQVCELDVLLGNTLTAARQIW